MPKKKPQSENSRIVDAALRIAATQGWGSVSLDKVAKAAKLPVAALHKQFKSVADLAPTIAAEIDAIAFASMDKMSGTPHDILFDLLMARFDILQQHRKAIISMADAARGDKQLACALGRATIDGAYRIIEIAALKSPPRPALALGLMGVYGWAFFVWQRDNSRDMAKTMAAIDRGLRLSGKATDLLGKTFDA